MQKIIIKKQYDHFVALILSFLTIFILFIYQGHQGFSLADEGFLWYGAQRVVHGEVPIRDFMAYDPGRYYWSAAIMELLGNNGIMSLRIALAVFQSLGLVVGISLISRSVKKQNLLFCVISFAILVLWMYPRHKLFDVSLSIFSIGILTYLIENPSGRRFFITGICIGLIAIFGRNHGMYGAFGSFGVMIWLQIGKAEHVSFFKNFLFWALGVAIGFVPLLIMLLVVPGFAYSFWESIRFLFELKSTNLTLPIPWPWLTPFNGSEIGDSLRNMIIGSFFVCVLVFGVASVCWVFWKKYNRLPIPPALVGAAMLALPYMQFAFSRAELNHLAQGIFPFLIGGLVFLSIQAEKIKWPLTILLLGASIWTMIPAQPAWICARSQHCVPIPVSGDTLQVEQSTADDINLLRSLTDRYARDGRSFIATPLWPGAYATFGRISPMWEIYPLFSRPPEFEQGEIQRIKKSNPGFVVIVDLALDGQDCLRYQNTHPLIYQYIRDNYERIKNSPNPNYLIFKAKDE